MVNAFNAKGYATKSGTDYNASQDLEAFQLVYAPNAAQICQILLDNNDGSLDSAFACEDRVSVSIDTGGGGVKMLDGYVVRRIPKRVRMHKYLLLTIMDYIGYLAPKTVYESRYWRYTQGQKILKDAVAAISGASNSGIDTSNITATLKADFIGTQVSDVFNYVGEVCGCDWFGDESLALQAFRHEPGGAYVKYLQTGGVTYKIQDVPPAGGHPEQIMVLHDDEQGYWLGDDATNLYHNVKVTLGVDETIPRQFDAWTRWDNLYHNTVAGCLLAKNIFCFGTPELGVDHATGINWYNPRPINGPLLGANADITTEALRWESKYTTDDFHAVMQKYSTPTANPSYPSATALGIALGTYSQFRMYCYIDTNGGGTPASISLRLYDSASAHYYYRDIKTDIGNGSSFQNATWRFVLYNLPVSGDTSNGWTKDTPGATVNNIDRVEVYVYKSGGPTGSEDANTSGWPVGSSFQFLIPHFWRTYSKTHTSAAAPATTKVISNKTFQSQTAQQNFADYEFNRLSTVNYEGRAMIFGNTDFRKPGYYLSVDFSTTLNKSATARLERIVHRIAGGQYTTELFFNNPLQRV